MGNTIKAAITDKDLDAIEKLFRKTARSQPGAINKEEWRSFASHLAKGLESTEPLDEFAERTFRIADSRKDGSIVYQEFKTFFLERKWIAEAAVPNLSEENGWLGKLKQMQKQYIGNNAEFAKVENLLFDVALSREVEALKFLVNSNSLLLIDYCMS